MGVHFLTKYRNPLAYPAGYAPGFDPNHVAALNPVFSSVASGANHINILTGTPATVTGTPLHKIKNVMGPTLDFDTSNANYVNFSGFQTTAIPSGTLGMILELTSSIAGYNYIFTYGPVSGGSATGCLSLIQGNIFKMQNNTGSIISSGVTLEVGVPYFLACCFSDSLAATDFYIKDLKTGQFKTAFLGASNAITAALSGNCDLGTSPRDHQIARTSFAAAMFSRSYTPRPAMMQWAADPWSFWYPNPGDNWIAAQSTAFPYWAARNNNFVIGTGIQ